MPTPALDHLRVTLNHDLSKLDSKRVITVVDDSARKTFTAREQGAVLEFSHKQPDLNFWNGVKYYSSGTRSRIRFPRTQVEAV